MQNQGLYRRKTLFCCFDVKLTAFIHLKHLISVLR